MITRPLLKRIATLALLPALATGLALLPGLTPSAEAASTSASARIIKKLKKQIKSLKAQLAAARATAPAPTAFIEMVKVGNVGNAADSTTYGAVPYEYSIGKHEVTLAQYTAFLNAVAATDTYFLYSPSMATDTEIAGIVQNGASPNFTYSLIGAGTRPVTYASWFDAARFCNWLHNGRPTGLQTAATTERGAYTLDGATNGGLTITRNPGAKYWIPSENEWYKAAYHDPRTAANGGPTGDDFYWLYPTGSDTAPTAEVPPGGSNSANFSFGLGTLTAAGAYTGSASFYGTFDQGGNAFEWNDAVISGSSRGKRGGAWSENSSDLRSSNRSPSSPNLGNDTIGFRVASP
jgi:formylglycine-generating enzyme